MSFSLEIVIAFVFGLLLGCLITYIFASAKARSLALALTKKETELEYVKRTLDSEKERLETVEQRLADTFRNITNEALQKSSTSLSQHHQELLNNVLAPLKERIKEFQEKVENTHKESLEKNSALVTRINQLEQLGLQMSEEADKLTKALKGEVKTQGTWGEVILERILEQSGLRKGIEYFAQGSGLDVRDDNGRRLRPDIVVQLPEDKHVIIDSKVSLVAYERLVNSESQESKDKHSKEVVLSIKAHIDRLSSQHYQHKQGVKSPDFVLLFLPLESTFSAALSIEPSLFQYGWDRKVVIVTPTTLLATLWTVANIWRQEHQNANAQEIAKKSGALYDKFVGFVNTFTEIGKNLDKSREAYDRAFRQLSTGRANLISQAETLRTMGAETTKNIDENLLEKVEHV